MLTRRGKDRSKKTRPRPLPRRRPTVEGLERRELLTGNPTVWTVDSTGDGMAGSGNSGTLLYCVTGANADTNTAGDTIEFDPTAFATVKEDDVTGGAIELTNTVGLQTIDGQGLELTIEEIGTGSVITVASGVQAQVFNLTISGGATPGDGGGVNNDGELSIVDSTISGNTIENQADEAVVGGAGVYNGPDGYLTMSADTVSDNTILSNGLSYGYGAGIENFGHLSMYNSTVSGNLDAYGSGSGIANYGDFALIDDTIADNTTSLSTAAVFAAGEMTAINCTIADNVNGGGGGFDGLYATGISVILINTILVDNTDPKGLDYDLSGADNSVDFRDWHNDLIGNTDFPLSPQGLDNGVNGNLVGVTDPGLGALADDGGPTQAIALNVGSPAIDAGDVTYVTPQLFGDPPTDQRGDARIVGGSVDIGAYQSQPAGNPTLWTVDSTADGMAGSGNSGTLLYCVAGANADSNIDGDTIQFDPTTFASTKTLDVANGEIELTNKVGPETIDDGSLGLTIDGTGIGSVITVANGVSAQLFNLSITGGMTDGGKGAGVYNDGQLSIVDSTIDSNEIEISSGASGGAGIYNGTDGYLTMLDDSVSGDGISGGLGLGGGIDNAGYLSMYDSTVSGCGTGEADGIGVSNETTGVFALIDDTIADNGSELGTAAVYNAGGMTMINCTVAQNSTYDTNCGVDAAFGDLVLLNTIVAGNTAIDAPAPYDLFADPGALDIAGSRNNLIGSAADTDYLGLVNGENGNMVGVADPGLGRLADNGGPTETIALDAGSPAIGAGDVTYITPQFFGDPPTDQRGEPRIVGGSVDIGAYQTQT